MLKIIALRILPINYCLDQQVDIYDFEYVLEQLSEEKYLYNEKFEYVMACCDGDDSDNLWDLYARFSNVLQKINLTSR